MKHGFSLPLFALAAQIAASGAVLLPSASNPYAYSPGLDPLPNHGFGVLKCADFGVKLTDGAYGDLVPGERLASADPSAWVEFSGIGEATFHFSGSPTIRNVTVSLANWTPAAIYLPDAFRINGEIVTYSGTFPDMNRALISLDGEWTGADLTLNFSRVGGGYFFLDEVSFYGTPGEGVAAVPEPASCASWTALGVAGLALKRRRRHA